MNTHAMKTIALLPLAALLLGACAQMPSGPSVTVMPAANKPFEVFMADEDQCRDWAGRSIGGRVSDSANASLATSAAVGTAVGAAAGALLGGNGRAAGTGAAVGLATGTMVGADQSRLTGGEAQRRYDSAYLQCMYAKGNQLPSAPATTTHYRVRSYDGYYNGGYYERRYYDRVYVVPPTVAYPPPPAGYPPPPPAGTPPPPPPPGSDR